VSVWLKFSGWFQCRLATDPDPSDEPRGVSGYVHAVAGEPDLDRIIRLQPVGTTWRSYCPGVGVGVVSVYGDPRTRTTHPLIDATVEFLDGARFEGRNHILAEDGFEAVVPLHIRIRKNKFLLQRKFDDSMKFPPLTDEDRGKFAALQATGINISPGAIGDATGIFDLSAAWLERTGRLKTELQGCTDEIQRAALKSRITSLSDPRNARYFAARMLFSAALTGSTVYQDPDEYLPTKAIFGPDTAWPLEFWCGAWDADALCGYIVGYLGVAMPKTGIEQGVASMMSHPTERRR
jgi:hypothetical protein